MTTLNPGDIYRFKLIDDAPGALDYDTSLEWSARVLHVSYFDESGIENHDEYVYTGERVISVTVPDVSTQLVEMNVYFDSTCNNMRPEYLPSGMADGYGSNKLTFTVN